MICNNIIIQILAFVLADKLLFIIMIMNMNDK